MKLKTQAYGILAGVLTLTALSQTALAYETSGKVKMYLMNPEGRVDGLLLSDGMQIHFPPHLSDQLVALVKKSDTVTINGEKESATVVRADVIKNDKSGTSLKDTPPTAGEEPRPPMPPPPAGPNGPLAGAGAPPPAPPLPPHLQGLKEMKAKGSITQELTGRRGEVNGVILDNATIVHFGPRVLDESKVKLAKGSTISVTGFGTKNEYGESIEATEISK